MKINEFTTQVVDLNGVLRSFTKHFNLDLEESRDLVQDTILKALLNKEKFKAETNLKGWLFTIMRNTFINNYRKNKRTKTSRDTTKELYYLNVADTHTFNSPGASYEYNDLWRNINELGEDLLVPFKMYTSGYKYQEIAEHLEIPIGRFYKSRVLSCLQNISFT